MERERLSWALGWASLGIGLTELTFAGELSHVLGASRRGTWLFRALGLRELATGWGLLRQPHRTRWVWARFLGDVMDLSLLTLAPRESRASRRWQGLFTAVVAGAALADFLAARRHGAAAVQDTLPSLGMEAGPGVPHESWRGSGLAEDVSAHGESLESAPLSEEARHRMMDDAARKLGLPELN